MAKSAEIMLNLNPFYSQPHHQSDSGGRATVPVSGPYEQSQMSNATESNRRKLMCPGESVAVVPAQGMWRRVDTEARLDARDGMDAQ